MRDQRSGLVFAVRQRAKGNGLRVIESRSREGGSARESRYAEGE
jgi:hypothetical protein